ncbi:MAG TPA: hypothetical protein VF797_17675, partial [Noviherbaspirillum sp.]
MPFGYCTLLIRAALPAAIHLGLAMPVRLEMRQRLMSGPVPGAGPAPSACGRSAVRVCWSM